MPHTTGPWHSTRHGSDAYIWGQDKTKRGCIARVNLQATKTTDNAEREANAKLIEAAPDLLDALKRLLYTAAPYCASNHFNIELARAAIAKAS